MLSVDPVSDNGDGLSEVAAETGKREGTRDGAEGFGARRNVMRER
jgi:hypothetical protein